MTQKVLKVGSSAAVTIPKASLEELGLRIGDKVTVEVDTEKKIVSVKPIAGSVNKELLDWTKKFIARYRTALEELARK